MIDKNEIIILYKNNTSIKEIVRITGFSRNTVRKFIREYNTLNQKLLSETNVSQIALIQEQICSKPKRKSPKKWRIKFTKDVERRFLELIHIDEERNKALGSNKQGISATLVHSQLISEGYDIGLSTITEEFRNYKNKNKECYIKQSYEYGQRAEYDFHQIKVLINGVIKTYHQATISLPKSNYVFGKLYPNENIETVIDSIVKFIEHCGGVFNEMVFDNMSTVVKRFMINNKKQYTDEIIKLSNYYGFKINTCNARSGNEKGHVENSGKLVRKKLFSLKYSFDSEDDLVDYYNKELKIYNTKSLVEFNKEIKTLKTAPLHPYLYRITKDCVVNSYSLVTFENNFYSVPESKVGKSVLVNKIGDNLIIYDNDIQISSHKIKKGFKEYSIDINHYLQTFLKKPGALANSLAMKQAPEELKRIFIEDYNMNSKLFIEDLINPNKTISIYEGNSIEDTSINQLEAISNMFDQGRVL